MSAPTSFDSYTDKNEYKSADAALSPLTRTKYANGATASPSCGRYHRTSEHRRLIYPSFTRPTSCADNEPWLPALSSYPMPIPEDVLASMKPAVLDPGLANRAGMCPKMSSFGLLRLSLTLREATYLHLKMQYRC
jgi:hypothetical protein